MKTYGQYCPIARASEVLAERWTPLIVRNILLGSSTFTEIADGAPGLSRSLLTTRLRELERVGVIEREPNPNGRGSLYRPTEAGRELSMVMAALGTWGERWIELAPEHLDPGVVLHSWVSFYLDTDRLPEDRVVAEFRFPGLPRKANQLWVIFDGDLSEVCRTYPGFEIDLYVEIEPQALAEWHLGRIEWADARRTGRIKIEGAARLVRELPTWNRRSAAARSAEARPQRVAIT